MFLLSSKICRHSTRNKRRKTKWQLVEFLCLYSACAYFMPVPTCETSVTPSSEISKSASRRKPKRFSSVSCAYFTLVHTKSFLVLMSVLLLDCAYMYLTSVNQVLVSNGEIHDFKFIQKCSAAFHSFNSVHIENVITLGISSLK